MEPQRHLPNLTADILREIFLRAASPADLVRTAAACDSFCCLIADPAFLRRYRSLHPPPLLGFIDRDGLHPVQAPHPNAAAARAFARSVDFSFGYLPRKCDILDVRDGRILVLLLGDKEIHIKRWDLAVCDPMSRQYHLVRTIPDNLLASAQIQLDQIINSQTFFFPSEDVEETSFRVIRCILVKTGFVLFVFSSRSGCWSFATSTSWDALSLDEPEVPERVILYLRCYAYGCFYWKLDNKDKLLKLDLGTMKFSTHDLPPDHAQQIVAVVEAGDGKLAMFSHIRKGSSLDYYIFLQDDSKKGGEWHMKNTILLPSQHECHNINGQSKRYIFLCCIQEEEEGISYLALDIYTFKVERLAGIRFPAIFAPYFGFRPIIFPRRIQGYEMD